MKITGTVQKMDIGPGVLVLSGDDGKTYQLKNGRKFAQNVGQRVEVEATIDESISTAAMVGPILDINDLKVL